MTRSPRPRFGTVSQFERSLTRRASQAMILADTALTAAWVFVEVLAFVVARHG